MSESNINQLYADLQKYGSGGDYEKALKSANKILHTRPDDEKAFICRIISLIHLQGFEDALISFSKSPKLAGSYVFEKAYCQYRANHLEEALATLNGVKQGVALKLLELKAQIYYRLEKYEECLELYREIIKNSDDEYDEERQVNLAAVVANLSLSKKEIQMPGFTHECFELTYNQACQLIAKGLYGQAEPLLALAIQQCRDSFDEDATPEEVEEELTVLKLQQAFCLQRMGRAKEAGGLYTQVLRAKPSDPCLLAIASNNSVAINKYKNLFDSKKKIKSALTEAAQQKLTSAQKEKIAINNCLLNVYTSQGDGAAAMCAKIIDKYPAAKGPVTLARAVVVEREGKWEEAVTMLRGLGHQSPESKLVMELTVVQLLLSRGELGQAARVLEELGEATFKPGIVSALITLYSELGETGRAAKLLEQAVDWHRSHKTSLDLSELWRHAAKQHLRGGRPEVAATSLEQLLQRNPNDSLTLAQLILACAQFDPAKARALSQRLPQLVDLTPNMDIALLESSSWMKGSKVLSKKQVNSPAPRKTPTTPATPKQEPKKKKRKPKLPKNYDPNVDPDPERWLPRKERSNYRKKKDRRGKDIGKGTQGTTAGSSDQFDITKMAGTGKGAAAATSPGLQPPHHRKPPQYKKKKKGGSKR